MKKLIVWAEMTLKRLTRRKGFLLLLAALPLIGLFTAYWEQHHTQGVEIGLLQNQDPVARAAIDRLLASDGLFEFRLYEDEATLRSAVETRILEAGFVFSPDLSGQLQARQVRDLVRLLRSPSTVTDGMAAEVVFSQLIHAASPDILRDVVVESGLFPGTEGEVYARIWARYQDYDRSGGTYRFDYEYLDGSAPAASGIPLFPTKGLISVFVMLTAWISVLSWYRDEEDGIYGAFAVAGSRAAGFLSVFLPVVVMTLAGFLLCLTRYPASEAFRELAYLLFYGTAAALFLFGAKRLFPNPVAFGALMPVALLGSLVASPVILDMTRLVPGLEILEKLFLPSYYLALSSGKSWGGFGLILIALTGGILLALPPAARRNGSAGRTSSL